MNGVTVAHRQIAAQKICSPIAVVPDTITVNECAVFFVMLGAVSFWRP